MVDISRETYLRNITETIVDNDGILWLNEKHIEEGFYKKLGGNYSKISFRPQKA